MSDAIQQGQQHAEGAVNADKGKGKAHEDTAMGSSDEEDDEEYDEAEGEVEEADEDNMEEIDEDNIVGRRTRGKNIDFAKAADELRSEDNYDDEEDEDDDDFEAEDEEMAD